MANMCRYESDGTVTFVASRGEHFPVGSRWPIGGEPNPAKLVFDTGRAARVDNYADATGPIAEHVRELGIRSAVGTPIIVEGRLWGVMTAGSSRLQLLPPDTEARLASFMELVATAIANAESRAGLARLAEEQAALRRMATLVARGIAAEELFAAVADEVGRLLLVEMANMCRYEYDGTVTFVASRGEHFPVGSRWPIRGETNVAKLVLETGGAARVDNYADATGPIAEHVRDQGIRSAVGAPIIVDGRLWGVMTAGSSRELHLPADTEARLASFTALVATVI